MTQIYKIIDNTNGNIYVGSTKQKLHRRIGKHEEMKGGCSSKEVIKNGNYRVEIIEVCNEKNRNEKEEYWINNLDTVNIRRKIHSFDNKKYKRQYYENHIEEKKQYDKIRRDWKISWGETKRDICNLTYTDTNLFC